MTLYNVDLFSNEVLRREFLQYSDCDYIGKLNSETK